MGELRIQLEGCERAAEAVTDKGHSRREAGSQSHGVSLPQEIVRLPK